MTKKMLIDDTQKEETRVVIVDGNKVEDVEFESTSRKQIKGNIYTARVVRVEPSLQAAFIDYGGNKHGFLAFSEIHPDYYHVSSEVLEALDKEVDEIVENKKQYIRQRQAERARIRAEKKALYEARKLEEEHLKAEAETALKNQIETTEAPETENIDEQTAQTTFEVTPPTRQSVILGNEVLEENKQEVSLSETETGRQENTSEENELKNKEDKHVYGKRKYVRRTRKDMPEEQMQDTEFKVLSAETEEEDDRLEESSDINLVTKDGDDDELDIDISENITDDEFEYSFEVQRKLIRARKLYHNSTIQDVIKEGQILLVQVVKEERGNKGASFTTYLSLAGRYGVLMPNRIKSGGVSRKITNAADRKRLKDIMKTLPLSMDMSLIIRTAGEDKPQEEIVRDYNYLIRTWNLIRENALKNKAPALIYEEGDLIKRALRDMCSNDISEIIVDGDNAYKSARDFVKILSPQDVRKIKCRKPYEPPVFQRYQVESQLDKLHNPIVQLESGGYLVINPTEALVAIDVNSGRATKELDIEETALNTNLEAADEIARQLKMRDLAGLIVVDFIDMDEQKNNVAVEKRMKEALKTDRARVQVARMSCFGLLEISRQRMHSSFVESNYETCPYCHGQGVMRTIESGAALILREVEEEGVKNKYSGLIVSVPTDIATYLLNQKRKTLADLEERYRMSVIISADNSIKNVSDFKIERQRVSKIQENISENAPTSAYAQIAQDENTDIEDELQEQYEPNFEERHYNRRFNRKRGRFNRRYNRGDKKNEKKESPVILYSSDEINLNNQDQKKTAWWRRLIG